MPQNNFDRMVQLAQDFFGMRDDPSQLSVDEKVMEQLRTLHPSTLTEERDPDGPVAWILVIPTTTEVMRRFLSGNIPERELLGLTPVGIAYEAIYLCSALVLPEHRHQGIAKRLTERAVTSIQKEHPVKYLFYWSFSAEGKKLATSVAEKFSLPLLQR